MNIVKLLVSLLMALNITCTRTTEPDKEDKGSSMFVYSNAGNKFYYINDKTFQITKECNLKDIDSLNVLLMGISNNNDYLIFSASNGKPFFQHYLIVYHILSDSIYSVFSTGLDSVGAPRLSPSYQPHEPGLIYMYSHTVGTYAIDFFKKEVTLISDDRGLEKSFNFSLDKKILIIKKTSSHLGIDQSEIEVYNTTLGLRGSPVLLNNTQQNGMEFEDLIPDLSKLVRQKV